MINLFAHVHLRPFQDTFPPSIVQENFHTFCVHNLNPQRRDGSISVSGDEDILLTALTTIFQRIAEQEEVEISIILTSTPLPENRTNGIAVYKAIGFTKDLFTHVTTLSTRGNVLQEGGSDDIHGTPVLDIKPV